MEPDIIMGSDRFAESKAQSNRKIFKSDINDEEVKDLAKSTPQEVSNHPKKDLQVRPIKSSAKISMKAFQDDLSESPLNIAHKSSTKLSPQSLTDVSGKSSSKIPTQSSSKRLLRPSSESETSENLDEGKYN